MAVSKPFIQTLGCKVWPEKNEKYLGIMREIARLAKKSKYLASFSLWNNIEDPQVYIERYEYKSRQHYNRFKRDKRELARYIPLMNELNNIIDQKDLQQNLWYKIF